MKIPLLNVNKQECCYTWAGIVVQIHLNLELCSDFFARTYLKKVVNIPKRFLTEF